MRIDARSVVRFAKKNKLTITQGNPYLCALGIMGRMNGWEESHRLFPRMEMLCDYSNYIKHKAIECGFEEWSEHCLTTIVGRPLTGKEKAYFKMGENIRRLAKQEKIFNNGR